MFARTIESASTVIAYFSLPPTMVPSNKLQFLPISTLWAICTRAPSLVPSPIMVSDSEPLEMEHLEQTSTPLPILTPPI